MADGFDLSLLGSHSALRKGYAAMIANLGKTVAVITLIIAAMVSFTEIGFSDVHAQSFSTTLIMMLIASYVMYFSLEDAGEKLGRESEEYKAVCSSYAGKRASVGGEDISALRKFCFEYQSEELEFRKMNALLSLGYTKEEYEAFKRGEAIDKKARRAMAKIDKLKRSRLCAHDLLSRSAEGNTREIRRPGISKLFFMLWRLAPSTVCMLFTVSVMVSAKDGLTAFGIIESAMKLATLPIIGLKGYAAGYEYVLGDELAWVETKTNLLDAFLNEKALNTH